ncbi:hypothetical protein, partial [Bacillus rhizoplanae]|uniref:hypothetical protein n=1 Tax=Bacillus rhizoplanae TaxID=2880966 RepID=UPI001E46EC54
NICLKTWYKIGFYTMFFVLYNRNISIFVELIKGQANKKERPNVHLVSCLLFRWFNIRDDLCSSSYRGTTNKILIFLAGRILF